MTDGISGLRWHSGPGGRRRALWRASKKALAAGFPIASRPLWRGLTPTDQEMGRIIDTCLALARAQRDWINGKRGRPSPKAGVKGDVYFVQSGCFVKIGFTTNLSKRIASLQTSATERLELIGSVKCTADRERLYHTNFGRYRLRGEWFKIEGELATFLQVRFGGAHAWPCRRVGPTSTISEFWSWFEPFGAPHKCAPVCAPGPPQAAEK
jgi:hypothetical protein